MIVSGVDRPQILTSTGMAQLEGLSDCTRRLGGIGSPGDGTPDDQNVGAIIARGARCSDALLILHIGISGANARYDGEEFARGRGLHRSDILRAADDAS